jgi:hypothetical protein
MSTPHNSLAEHQQSNVGPAAETGSLDFTSMEVRQLWSFLDGAIMALDTRQHLWRSWGLCPRHAWGSAVVEIEVHGGTPLSTAILYEDLCRRAARLLGRRLAPTALVRSQLRSHASCFTCDYLSMLDGDRRAETPESDRAMMRRVNERSRTSAIFEKLGDLPVESACPRCLGGSGPICRPHLLDRDDRHEELAEELAALARRLRTLIDSMTTKRAKIGALEEVSWIEALGWFGGWDYAQKLAGLQSANTAGR